MKQLALAVLLTLTAEGASAQTADDVIEKSLAALGGRGAHAKIVSRSIVGTITFTTPAGDISGPIEILNAAPNKVRTLIKADLTSLGAGQLTVDQRFDGQNGHVTDSMRGNRELTGSQLDSLRNTAFPHLFLRVKELGMTATVSGKERVGDRDAYVLVLQPKQGAPLRHYIDAATFLPIKVVMTIGGGPDGADVEQTAEVSDFRDVDGIKVPFRLRTSSSVQTVTIAVTTVAHNVKVDDALFRKPATP